MNPTAEAQTAVADLLARAAAMFARHEAAKAPPPEPAPKAPRVCRIAEAKQGASWVAELSEEQRAAAGVADDWKAQAISDLEALGGVPPAPPRRIGRPRKVYRPIEAPADLVTELPGEVEAFDPFAPTPPVARTRSVETAPEAEAEPAVEGGAHRRAVQLAFPFVDMRDADAAHTAQRAPANHTRRHRGLAGSSRLSRAGPGLRPTRPATNTRTHGGSSWTSLSDRRAAYLEESGQLSFLRSA